MPLSIDVGLSRKSSRDYQSAGVSINVTAELDQALLAKPEELQRQVADLYEQARQAMEKQAGFQPEPRPLQHLSPGQAGGSYPQRGNGNVNGTANANVNANANCNGKFSNGNFGPAGPMTSAQRRAIQSLAHRLDLLLDQWCREIIGTEFDELTVRQASELIDHFKSLQSNGGSPPRGRDYG